MKRALNLFVTVVLLVGAAPADVRRSASAPRPERPATAEGAAGAAYGKIPLSFERNEGQTDGAVRYVARGAGYALFLTEDGATLALAGNRPGAPRPIPDDQTAPEAKISDGGVPGAAVMRMKFANSGAASVSGEGELPGKVNYLRGSDPSAWRTNIATYSTVRYASVYPGIDAVYYGDQHALEYDFVVAPGADPSAIELEFEGADAVRIDDAGDLVVTTGGVDLRQKAPALYQETAAGERRSVGGRFETRGRGRIGFACDAFDRSAPLVIDPVIEYSTYLGGSDGYQYAYEAGTAIAVDAAGSAYVTGWTTSNGFPTANAIQPLSGGGDEDAFVTKLSPDGSSLVYSTYFGGSSLERGLAIAVDASGSAAICGRTYSPDLPTTSNAYDVSRNGTGDGFVARLSPSGSSFVFATYLGGSSDYDQATAVTYDPGGRICVAGFTSSADFPVPNGFDTTTSPTGYSVSDAFAVRLGGDGSSLLYGTFLGGTQNDAATSIAADASGNLYIGGTTSSPDFPTTRTFDGTAPPTLGQDAGFVAEIADSGAMTLGAFVGGSSSDAVHGLAVDSVGALYVTGITSSSDFPTVNAYDTTLDGPFDGFAMKISASHEALDYATYYGGAGDDVCRAISVDASGAAYVTGYTTSNNLPTPGGFDTSYNGQNVYGTGDAFVAKLAPGGATLVYGTYLGGRGVDAGAGIAVSAAGSAYVTGSVAADYFGATTFPITPGAFDTTFNGGTQDQNGTTEERGDVFVTKLAPSGATLDYSTFLGGGSDDSGIGLTADAAGAAYLVGETYSFDFPLAGGVDHTLEGQRDAFVTKLDPSGTSVVYSTYIGGTKWEYVSGIAVDGAGSAYVTGVTASADFPTANAFLATAPTPYQSVFAAKISSAGDALLYSTYLCPGHATQGNDIAVGADGTAYVVGSLTSSSSAGFPFTNAIDSTVNGGEDEFVIAVNPTGSSLLYATLLGGTHDDYAQGVAIDGTGAAYLVSTVGSDDFPFVGPSISGTPMPNAPFAVVTKIAPGGGAVVYSTPIGGTSGAFGADIAVDAAGSAYITGATISADFPLANPIDSTLGHTAYGDFDAFVAKLAPSGASLVYSTYLGGARDDRAVSIAIDAAGSAYVAGITKSEDFPAVDATARQPAGYDAFIAHVSPSGTSLLYSTVFGGRYDDMTSAVAVDAGGHAYVVGTTTSEDYPVQGGVSGFRGGTDVFVTKLSPGPAPCDAPVITSQPASQSIAANATATLSVAASGTVTGYQWYAGASGNTSAPVAGATAATFTTPPLSATASYWVRVTNACGSVDSAAATVTVAASCAPPAIASQPQSQTVAANATATLSVAASGDAPLAYQWYAGAAGDASSPVAGATSATFTTPPIAASAAYWVRVTNRCGSADSTTAVVSAAGAASADLRVAASAEPATAAPGQTAVIRATVANDGPTEAASVTLTQSIPEHATFVSAAAPAGWTASAPAPGARGTIVFSTAALPVGASAQFEVTIRVDADAANGATLASALTVLAATADADASDNAATATVSVTADGGGADAPTVSLVEPLASAGKPWRVRVRGANFAEGVTVFIGADASPWPGVKRRDAATLVLKGTGLKKRFPKHATTTVRVVNPDGSSATGTLSR